MYRYSPPKSNIWGHSLRNMEPERQKSLFNEFLKQAVAEHQYPPRSGSLTFFVGPAPAFFPAEAQAQWGHVTSDDVQRFEQLLGVNARGNGFYALSPEQCELAFKELLRNKALLPGSMLLEGITISKWLIEGQPVPTQSMMNLYYGMKPCVSTFLEFETLEHFAFIQRVLSDLDFCKLSEKHLKPIKQRGSKKNPGKEKKV